MDEDPRHRLARLIQARRRELRLSERQAAAIAGVARNTWASAEEGARQPSERSVAGIEAALRWTPGSIDRILAGGIPTPQGDGPALPADFDLDAEIARAARLDVAPETRLAIIRRLIDVYEEAQAERQAAAKREATRG